MNRLALRSLSRRCRHGSLCSTNRADDESSFCIAQEADRRRYAAIEAAKLGHGGVELVARVLGCDPKTIQRGIEELEGEDVLDPLRSRKKGVDARP